MVTIHDYDTVLAMDRGDGQRLLLIFGDDQHWGDDWSFCVIATAAKDGQEVAIDYYPPHLDRDVGEPETDYLARCVDSIDWSKPDYIDCLSDDPESPYQYDPDVDTDVSFEIL